jgi:hypothetical protein
MGNKILVTGMLSLSLISISQASYTVIDSNDKYITICDDLTIEKDDQNRFSRAVFSKCRNKEVFSYTGNFRYRED